METIGKQHLWSFVDGNEKTKQTNCAAIRNGNSALVTSYLELAKKIAELQFLNRDFVLVFRGQSDDYRNKAGNTSLKPSIMRAVSAAKVLPEAILSARYRTLSNAEILLLSYYRLGNTAGGLRLRRQTILRWALLQHYEICKTPLLDVTHSIRIAASFASDGGGAEGYVFVLGVPNLSGAVTASAEAGIQIIRLSSVCPPSAVRPHIQEGYLLGEYPEMRGVDQKQHYKHYEIDFGRRLVAKFRFQPTAFWASSPNFPPVSHDALYPSPDPVLDLAAKIKHDVCDQ